MGFQYMQICTIHFFDDTSVFLVEQFQFSTPELIILFSNEPPLTFEIQHFQQQVFVFERVHQWNRKKKWVEKERQPQLNKGQDFSRKIKSLPRSSSKQESSKVLGHHFNQYGFEFTMIHNMQGNLKKKLALFVETTYKNVHKLPSHIKKPDLHVTI